MNMTLIVFALFSRNGGVEETHLVAFFYKVEVLAYSNGRKSQKCGAQYTKKYSKSQAGIIVT